MQGFRRKGLDDTDRISHDRTTDERGSLARDEEDEDGVVVEAESRMMADADVADFVLVVLVRERRPREERRKRPEGREM